MKVSFRQGLVRYQTDIASTPTFLIQSNGGQNIDLIVSPDPTIITFAHKESDYLIEETQNVPSAWIGFTSGNDYWLYVDIDMMTGLRSFGHTTIEPVFGPTSPPQLVNQMWFDTSSTQMKLWNGYRWTTVIRVVVSKYDNGSVIQPKTIGSQVGLYGISYSGFVIFDSHERPVRRYNRRDAEFVTTESDLLTHASNNVVNFRFETQFVPAKALESIPKFSLIYVIDDEMGLANTVDPNKVATGMVMEDMYSGETGIYQSGGYITNEDWNFPIGTSPMKLFYDAFGQVSEIVPQFDAIHEIGTVINSDTVLLDIKQPIFLE